MADGNTIYGDDRLATDPNSDDTGSNGSGNTDTARSSASVVYPNLSSTQEWASGQLATQGPESKSGNSGVMDTLKEGWDAAKGFAKNAVSRADRGILLDDSNRRWDATPEAAPYKTSDGTEIIAPPGTDFKAVHEAGQANSIFPNAVINAIGSVPGAALNNFNGIRNAIGHYGDFDFQRGIDGEVTVHKSDYVDASNYAVGVYMQGAGYSLEDTIAIGKAFTGQFSQNDGAPKQSAMWEKGWNDANEGKFAAPAE
jgi:hypothetical protein